MRKFLFLTVAVAFAAAGCSSDGDGTKDAASSTTQAGAQRTDTSDTGEGATDGEGESTGAVAPDGMLEACNGANIYTDPGDVPEDSISSEEERTTIEQVAALSQPITEFKVVEEPNAEGGYLGFGETDGWAWYCVYAPDTDQIFYDAFQAPTAINGVSGPEDGQWDSVDLG